MYLVALGRGYRYAAVDPSHKTLGFAGYSAEKLGNAEAVRLPEGTLADVG